MDKAAEDNLAHRDCGQMRHQFRGIRMRKWGSWGSEIRMPKSRTKIWLGSYKTAEQAARAYDAAVYCLRGPNAKFNFPGSVPAIPSAFSLSRRQIQLAAARYAREQLPSNSISTSCAPQNNNDKSNDKVREEPEYPSRSSLVSEKVLETDSSQKISGESSMALYEGLFDGSNCLNLEKFPSIDEALGLNAIPTWQEAEQDEFFWNL